jgi:hypothetical protein
LLVATLVLLTAGVRLPADAPVSCATLQQTGPRPAPPPIPEATVNLLAQAEQVAETTRSAIEQHRATVREGLGGKQLLVDDTLRDVPEAELAAHAD